MKITDSQSEEYDALRGERIQAHHVLDVLNVPRTEKDGKGGEATLTLLGRLRRLQAREARLVKALADIREMAEDELRRLFAAPQGFIPPVEATAREALEGT